MDSKIQVGLIGYGFAGRVFHAPIITAVPDLELKKVVERRSERSKERYPWVDIVRDANDLYEDPTIDLVVVTTPSPDHFQFVHDALSAGKHVVVEKPFTPTVEEADQLIELAKTKNKTLTVYHNRRWDGDFKTVNEIVNKGLIGEVKAFEIHWNGFNHSVSNNWRDDGGQGTGVLYDLGVHLLDQALCLFGIPKTIFADIQIQRKGGRSHDYFDLTLGYDNHLKVSLKSSKFVRSHGPRYILHGNKGSFIKYGLDPQEQALIEGEALESSNNWGRESKELWGRLDTSIGDLHIDGTVETKPGAYQDFYQNVADHINGKASLVVKPEEARMNIRLIELAIQSHKEGRILRVSP